MVEARNEIRPHRRQNDNRSGVNIEFIFFDLDKARFVCDCINADVVFFAD